MAQNDRTYKGPKNTTEDIDDSSSVTEKKVPVTDSNLLITPPVDHIQERFRRYFKLLARIQAIEEMTGLKNIVQGGASTGQDVRGTQKYHACHVLRVGAINSKLAGKNERLFKALTNFVGHTQYTLAEVNRWNGIGGAIDRFQSANLGGLDGITYGGKGYGATEKKKIQDMLDAMLKIIEDPNLKHGEYGIKAKEWIKQHNSDKGLKTLYEYMRSKFEEVKKGEFVKQWGKTVGR
ncbi:uncharacterized protein LOC126571080 [Anopheles aquasalis]|uniref:uncharacterized protein LOC126571080 n=1 Tax=Anopheles aquasalis TaxID=42839 RepID=UPI00215A1F66|nr:uncharacterized protein LOC126571080 [Anopheles aquasalis]